MARSPVVPAEGTDGTTDGTSHTGLGLSGTHIVRMLLLIPGILLVLVPIAMRDVYLHPTFFSSPVRFDSTDVCWECINQLLYLAVTAILFSHVLEAGRRSKLPAPNQVGTGTSGGSKPQIVATISGCFSWRLNARNMNVWDTFDVVEASVLAASISGGASIWRSSCRIADGADIKWATEIVIAIFWTVLIVFFIAVGKRICAAIMNVQGERTHAFVMGTALPITASAVCFQLYILFAYGNAGFSYPYSYPATPFRAASRMAETLAAGNNSRIRCDDEAAFWDSFQLPSNFECEEPLCGYREWNDLCQAWRVSMVASSTRRTVQHINWAVVILVFITLGLSGSGRIARTFDGELDLKRLLAPHIFLMLGLATAQFIITLNLLSVFFLQTPQLMQGQAPADPFGACGPGSFCFFCADKGLGTFFLGLPALALLSIDTLKRVLNRFGNRNRTYFLSYKQNDGNDGAVPMLAHLLGMSSVWLDKYASDRSEKGMVNGVTSQDVFVAIISPAYFNSEFCCLEIRTALKLGKPILIVWNQSKFTVQTALGWVQQLPQAELGILLESEHTYSNLTPPVPFLSPTSLPTCPVDADELLPIQEDIQMAGTCASRIKAATVKPQSPLALDMIGVHSFVSTEHAELTSVDDLTS